MDKKELIKIIEATIEETISNAEIEGIQDIFGNGRVFIDIENVEKIKEDILKGCKDVQM